MEYASKGDMIDLVNSNMKESYDLKFIRKHFRPVLKALKKMHSKNIAHNDIKLENIF